MTQSDIKRLTTLHNELKDIFDEYGPIGYIKELIELNSDFVAVINDIQNGLGLTDRPEKENADLVLSELRTFYNAVPNECHNRAHFQKAFVQLIDRVAHLEHFLGGCLNSQK